MNYCMEFKLEQKIHSFQQFNAKLAALPDVFALVGSQNRYSKAMPALVIVSILRDECEKLYEARIGLNKINKQKKLIFSTISLSYRAPFTDSSSLHLICDD